MAEEQIIRQDKDYRVGWQEGYNKCLEDYNIMQMAMVQFPHYTIPLNEGNKVLAAQISNLQEENRQAKKIIRELIDNLGKFYDDYPNFVIKAEAFLKE